MPFTLDDFNLSQDGLKPPDTERRNYFKAKSLVGKHLAFFSTGERATVPSKFEGKAEQQLLKAERVVILPVNGAKLEVLEDQWLQNAVLVWSMTDALQAAEKQGKRVACRMGLLVRDGEGESAPYVLEPLPPEDEGKVAGFLAKLIENGDLTVPEPGTDDGSALALGSGTTNDDGLPDLPF